MKAPSELQLAAYRCFLTRFVVFTDEEWNIFSSFLRLKQLRKKEALIETGQICTEAGYIFKGTVRYYHISDGEEVTGYFSFENELVSSYKSFLTRSPSLTSIEAIENAEILIFSKSDLDILVEDPRVNYKMERFGRMVAEFLLCCYEDRVHSFVTKSPEERYLELLKNRNDIIARIPQHYIANYLGITPVSLSRIRSRIMKPQEGTIKSLIS